MEGPMSKPFLLYTVAVIAILGIVASFLGAMTFLSDSGAYPFITYRGEIVYLFGVGVYRHMGEIMAYQGAAQDLVTLFVALPLLIIAAVRYDRFNLKSTVFLTGVVIYIAVTYTLYLFMATYSPLFIVYVLLAGMTLNLSVYLLYGLSTANTDKIVVSRKLALFGGGALMGIASIMGLLWLSVILPSVMEPSTIPAPLDHYTTLVVQGADLAFFLPWVFLSGYKAFRMNEKGFVFMNVAMVFISLLMLALSAKIIVAMIMGESGLPAIIILPFFTVIAFFHVGWFMHTPLKNHG